jgi:phytoene synthase
VSRDTSFYYSFLVLPNRKRRAIIAVWDFCRAVDDSVDQSTVARVTTNRTATVLESELAGWRHEVDCFFTEKEPLTVQGRRLKPHVKHFNLPRKSLEDLIEGVEMDIHSRRYETFDELYEYCLRVASSVGLICIEIFGYCNKRAQDYAISLGVALQLTNIIRDLPTDLEAGRLYLPLEDLRRFGCSPEALRQGMSTPVHELIRFECQRARKFYREATQLIPSEDKTNLVAAEIMAAIYFEILKRIERRGCDVFSEVVRVPRHRRAMIATIVWSKTILCSLYTGMTMRRGA